MPGFHPRIFLGALSLLCASAANIAPAAATRIEFGTQAGASWRIDVPKNWNHELVVYYHGYSTTPVTFAASEPLSPMFDPFLARGYALIQSGYSATGWAVEQAQADTETLRRKFVAEHGAPRRTYVAGISMGGTLTVYTIETHPEIYSGALSLCGAIEPTIRFMQHDFALRAAFDFYFAELLGPLVPMPADYVGDDRVEAKVAAAFARNPKAMQALLGLYPAATPRNLAAIIAAVGDDIKEMQQRTHGNPYGNADYIYVGSGDDAALNDGVKRYRAETKAAAYMARWYTPTGRLLRPLLALHDTGDPLVPASSAFEYALIALRAGHADNFVQQYVNHEGHCVFTPDQIGRSFDELVDWVSAGKRPAAGKLPAR
jgi:pimeloyl-ACP methyl ester carboxylesterase